jgi:hypothetical protein
LYGDVESITQVSYVLEDKFGKIKRGETIAKTITYFNEAGDVTEHIKYYSGGTLNRKYIYKYDAAGNMTEEARYNSDGSLNEKSICNYDAAGNMTEIAIYKSDGSRNYKWIYKYDDVGNVTGWTEYEGEIMTPKEEVEWKIVYRK